MSRDEILNPLDYADNPAELEVQRELQRLGIENEPQPEVCPHCHTDEYLAESGGYVGETVLYCAKCKKILWEDSEDAIRRVY